MIDALEASIFGDSRTTFANFVPPDKKPEKGNPTSGIQVKALRPDFYSPGMEMATVATGAP